MCTAVTNRFFPCDSRAASLVATGALVVVVASTALLGVAIYMQWGLIAMSSLSVQGVLALTAFAILICKKEEKDPLRVEREVCTNLYQAIIEEDVAAFEKGLEENPIEGWDFFFNHFLGTAAEDKKTIYVKAYTDVGYSLFGHIVMRKNVALKQELLRMALEKIPEHSVDIKDIALCDQILKIDSEEMVRLFFAKFNAATLKNIINRALDWHTSPCHRHWLNYFVNDPIFEDIYPFEEFIGKLVKSSVNNKIEIIRDLVARTEDPERVDAAIEEMEIKGKASFGQVYFQKYTGTLMHLAIMHKDAELVRELTKYKTLIEKPLQFHGHEMPPLHHAVMKKEFEIVKILVEAGANLYTTFKTKKENLSAMGLAIDLGANEISDFLQASLLAQQGK